MATSFGITPASSSIQLDEARHGEASFTVSNATGHPVRVRVSVVPVGDPIGGTPPPDQSWFTPPAVPERDQAIDGADQFTAGIDVPAGVAGGPYRFRLDAVSVTLPDEEWAHGPEVVCVVPEPPLPEPEEPPPPKPVRKGYVETVAGALLGGFAGGLGGGLIAGVAIAIAGALPSGETDLGEALGQIIFLVVLLVMLTAVAVWVGTSVGAFLFLRAQGFAEPIRTALPITFFLPIWAALLIFVVSRVDPQLDGAVAVILALILTVIAIVPPALAGRALFRFRTTGGL